MIIPAMSREDPQMKVRLPADLKDQVEAAAKTNNRSMNAEIVARLQASFSPSIDADHLEATVGYLIERNLRALEDYHRFATELQAKLDKRHSGGTAPSKPES